MTEDQTTTIEISDQQKLDLRREVIRIFNLRDNDFDIAIELNGCERDANRLLIDELSGKMVFN